ncbi:hypothetical protein B0H14DRAFT_340488 [Mycena olivaceomarginata]|nr:hypothetical protein B0H14DRAFT_340488 [Mycena olivaceomarginata]
MQKPVKKREPTACGLMQIPSNLLYYRFERKLLSKLATLAKVAVITAEEDVQVEFQVPRHVPNHVLLDDEEAYKVMVAAAIKCKDPKINLAVVRLQENDGEVSDAEDDKKKKKKEKKKSKIPSENDISAPNAEINAKIGLLRTKSTVVNFAFDGLAEILRPVIPATTARPPPQINEPQMLLPPNTQPGQPMLISMFCIEYNLDDSILDKLTANRYKNASAFRFIRLMDLEKMEFLPGDIAELQDAVRQWAVPL